jgi:hypothetical protein
MIKMVMLKRYLMKNKNLLDGLNMFMIEIKTGLNKNAIIREERFIMSIKEKSRIIKNHNFPEPSQQHTTPLFPAPHLSK